MSLFFRVMPESYSPAVAELSHGLLAQFREHFYFFERTAIIAETFMFSADSGFEN